MFSTGPMDRLGYLGYPNDADVDALMNQLSDESLLKLKMNTHNTSNRGFEYPTFTDGWMDDDATEALDTQLTSRFSSLKRPIAPAKKKGKDSLKVGKKGFNSGEGMGGKKASSRDSQPVFGQNSRDSACFDNREGRDSGALGRKLSDEGEDSRRLSSIPFSRTSSRRREDGSNSRRHPIRRETSRSLSQRTEFFSFRSSNDPAGGDDEEDPDGIDALLNERFRALKAPSPPTRAPPLSTSAVPSSRNLGLDNLIQVSGQLSTNDYEGYGSSSSLPSSPSADLLGRSKSRSSPRFLTSSVAASCHCSAPSALKLLKQVGSKSFPSKQQLSPAGSLPPLSPARRSSNSVKKAEKDYKVEGFGNPKPGSKDGEKSIKEKKEKKGTNGEANKNNKQPSTVKDMRSLLSSVADRVGFERSRVSSAVEDEFLGEDLSVWSATEGEQEFNRASTEEEKLNREAERVVEWAKDAARLETGESDLDNEADDLQPGGEDDDQDSDERKPSKKEKPQKKKGIKVAPRKKKWGVF